MWDRTIAADSLMQAWEKVASNGGAAGIDGVCVEDFAALAAENVAGLLQELQSGRYRPLPLRRVYIPKKSGGKRMLAIPAIRDRIVQTAVAGAVSTLLEPEFHPGSYGYRPGRSIYQAADRISAAYRDGFTFVVDADIEDFFDSIPHRKLRSRLRDCIPDRRICDLVELWLGGFGKNGFGLAQGSPISPVLSNLYLDTLDDALGATHAGVRLIRFADDFVVLAKSVRKAEAALEHTIKVLARLGLRLNFEKTRIVSFAEGFRFLGHLFVRSIVLPSMERDQIASPTALDEQMGGFGRAGRGQMAALPAPDAGRVADRAVLSAMGDDAPDWEDDPDIAAKLLRLRRNLVKRGLGKSDAADAAPRNGGLAQTGLVAADPSRKPYLKPSPRPSPQSSPQSSSKPGIKPDDHRVAPAFPGGTETAPDPNAVPAKGPIKDRVPVRAGPGDDAVTGDDAVAEDGADGVDARREAAGYVQRMRVLYLTQPGSCLDEDRGAFAIRQRDDGRPGAAEYIGPGPEAGSDGGEKGATGASGATGRVIAKLPVRLVDRVEIHPGCDLTFDARELAMRARVPIAWIDGYGQPVGTLLPPGMGNGQRHYAQAELIFDAGRRLDLARGLVAGRLGGQYNLLKRLARRRPDRVDPHIFEQMHINLRKLPAAGDIDRLMGLEGNGTRLYWMCYARYLRHGWSMPDRSRQPPTNPVNAVLSFVSHLLYRDLHALVLRHGLHPDFGVLHSTGNRNQACVSDLIEEFRAPVQEALTLRLFNVRRLRHADFIVDPVSCAVRLLPSARRRVISAYEGWLDRRIFSPSGGHHTNWRGLIEDQIFLYCAVIEGRVPEYVPYKPDY